MLNIQSIHKNTFFNKIVIPNLFRDLAVNKASALFYD